MADEVKQEGIEDPRDLGKRQREMKARMRLLKRSNPEKWKEVEEIDRKVLEKKFPNR